MLLTMVLLPFLMFAGTTVGIIVGINRRKRHLRQLEIQRSNRFLGKGFLRRMQEQL